MLINYEGLLNDLEKTSEPLGLLTMQATSTTRRIKQRFPSRLKALFSAEHGFFGTIAAGEKSASAWHPFFDLPIHSLYGDYRKPTPEMLKGISRMVIDLCDIGVRCYTYLATLKNTLEACAEAGIPVTVLDRPTPLGDVIDGPLVEEDYKSFVAPLSVPFCHGMTPGECALWIRREENLDLDLRVVRVKDWQHNNAAPWQNFIPPSPAIRSWDSAVLYPTTVFTEAYPAVDCDRQGALAFRVIGAPWLNAAEIMRDLEGSLVSCGVEMRPYRYVSGGGSYAGLTLNGILLSAPRTRPYYPVVAGVLIFAALMRRYGDKMSVGSRPEWLAKLAGSKAIEVALRRGNLEEMFQSWIAAQDTYLPSRVNLYTEGARSS